MAKYTLTIEVPEDNPDYVGREVQEALHTQGIEISDQIVSSVTEILNRTWAATLADVVLSAMANAGLTYRDGLDATLTFMRDGIEQSVRLSQHND